jgi:hypothetical protein
MAIRLLLFSLAYFTVSAVDSYTLRDLRAGGGSSSTNEEEQRSAIIGDTSRLEWSKLGFYNAPS